MFEPLPKEPDYDAQELAVLARWERDRTFERLRELNAAGPRFSFVDGPVTANKSLAVHTAWGRTLKDVFQRYKALRGYHQRYQNGFDCQGLWIEVGVERELGLNSKREIEEYGLAEFARKCRDVVVQSSEELTKGSIRLGQWMDWGSDYFTFSDTNIEYIWRFLSHIHEKGWLYLGHRSTEWCPRCGTSISAHELHGHYEDKVDPSLYVRFPLLDRPGEAVVVWTTTPWTLPANVAAAVRPDAEYGRLANGDWVAVARYPDETFAERLPGRELVGWRYEGPFDALGPGGDVEHRVIPWDEVDLETGTGIVHIAPGCGGEDFELSKVHDLAVLTPVDESGRFYPEYGWLHGVSTVEAADQIVGDLEERGLVVEAATYTHSYPFCWRCHTPLIFRLSDDWFISVAELRQPLLDANATVEWTPAYMGKRMDDWLRNMGDWNISRRRYYGLPLPFYPCPCGHLNVIGSRAELEARATGGLDQLEELRRPWIDAVPIRCEACGEKVTRIPEVGDVWLDAGIVPFSTLGWQSPELVPEGYGDRRGEGADDRRPPRPRLLGGVVPGRLGLGDARADPALVLLAAPDVGRARRPRAVQEGARLREDARRARPRDARLVGEHDRRRGRVRAHGRRRDALAVLRAAARPQPPLRLRPGAGDPAPPVDALELGQVLRRLRQHRGFRAPFSRISTGRTATSSRSTAGSSSGRGSARRRGTAGYESWLTVEVIRAFDDFVEDLSNWYIRRSRRRFWDGDETALRTLWYALVHEPTRGLAGAAVPRRAPVGGARRGVGGGRRTPSSSPAGRASRRRRRVARRGRRGAVGRRARPPGAQASAQGAPAAAAARRRGAPLARGARRRDRGRAAREERRVRARRRDELRVKPNLPVLGPRLGKELGAVRAALAAGDSRSSDGGRFRVLRPRARAGRRDRRAAGQGGLGGCRRWTGVTVALDTALDEELLREGRVNELVHPVNSMRKDAGLELTDRIVLTIPEADADLLEHEDWIKAETLAVEIRVELAIADRLVLVSGAVARRRARRVPRRSRPCRASPDYVSRATSSSSRRSSTGSRKTTSSSAIENGSIDSTPRARNQSHVRVTSFSGADAPDVMPTVSTPSSQLSSISVSSSIRCACTPHARATSTRRFELDEFREPITSSSSISSSISFTAHWRLEVA